MAARDKIDDMTLPPSSDGLSVLLDSQVLRLTMTRPRALNALNADMVETMVLALESAVARDDIRAVLISGAGRAFSAGADIGGESADSRFDQASVEAASRLVRAITSLDKPVVAAVNGVAAGVGCSLALSCDVIVAGGSASFVLAFNRIGLMPDGGATALLPAAIGRARAMRIALMGDPMSAAVAHQSGLITYLVDDDALADEVERVLKRLVAGPPLALAATKKAINAASLPGLEDTFGREVRGQSMLLHTDDAAEGMRAFEEKRKPQFTGN